MKKIPPTFDINDLDNAIKEIPVTNRMEIILLLTTTLTKITTSSRRKGELLQKKISYIGRLQPFDP